MKKLYFIFIILGFVCSVKAQILPIPDGPFKTALLAANVNNAYASNIAGNPIVVDLNNDNQIQVSEAQNVYKLWLFNAFLDNVNGIEGFTNLRVLNVRDNQLVNLDVTALSNLRELYAFNNTFTSLDLSGLANLRILECSVSNLNLDGVSLTDLTITSALITALNLSAQTNMERLKIRGCNFLSSLNISGLVHLKELDLSDNPLITNIDLSGFNELTDLNTESCALTNLNLHGCSSLIYLTCTGNQLTQLDVSDCHSLRNLYCGSNSLTTLDCSELYNMQVLWCGSNLLESLFIKNGVQAVNGDFSLYPNETLRYICVDDSELAFIQSLLNYPQYANCQVNNYCSFVPGGEYYTISGDQKIDTNGNGCDISDLAYPYFKMQIANGSTSGTIFAEGDGHFSIGVAQGGHTITPIIENPTYFTVSPANVVATFPDATSPFNPNFCISPNGVHQDIEVGIIPLNTARPGFDSRYKIIYKNKGNVTQSGSIQLSYNDSVLDFVSSNPTVSSQTANQLVFDFTQLTPFESEQVLITLNANSPTETPALNGGDVLHFTASIVSADVDETPADNQAQLNQTVVNSFDPNDKTCLEGATITPEMVGKYVHYLIRFENTGTANAENIVVKDLIDLTKFDISSLIPIDGSHPFVTKISAGNKVEFIFENINLPFDDANNDGYVAFKIKTKPTLVVGNTFSNTASIYFDYNFPIITNTATTTIAALAIRDFEFENYFRIYPNPAATVLNIDVKKQIAVSSISIYNTLGQLILAVPGAQQTKSVDISALKTGNYFLKIISDKGTSNIKFIKN